MIAEKHIATVPGARDWAFLAVYARNLNRRCTPGTSPYWHVQIGNGEKPLRAYTAQGARDELCNALRAREP